MLRFLVPVTFVLIWSTGFIVARAAAPHADLQFYLVLRFVSTAALMSAAAIAVRACWPRPADVVRYLLAGALMLGVYLCASYWAIARGMAAGVMSLLGSLQPLFTATFLAVGLRRQLPSLTWAGLCIGFAGALLVLAPKIAMTGAGSLSWLTVGAALLSVISVTAGALVQKWLPAADLRVAATIQNLGGAVVAALFTFAIGSGHWDGAPVLWVALVFAVLVPSVIGTTLLMWLMRHREATKVTSLILLVPPLAAVQAYLFFHETLSPLQFAGFALALAGVVLVQSVRSAAVAE